VVPTTVVSSRVNRSERIHLADTLPASGSADAIVIFGATVTEAGPCHELRVRLDHALKLWRHGVAPLLIVTGGQVGDIDEVSAMAAYLAAHGAPPEAIIEARPGANTRRSLRALKPLPYRQYVAVSTPSHSYRIAAEARRQGLSVAVNCPATTPEMADPRMHAARVRSEVLAVMLYAMPDPVAVAVLAALGRWRHSLPHVAAGRLRLRHASQPRAEITYRTVGSTR
jgi:uncharacterized SAM-binding protein YcdF (DUF218 family)